MKPVTGRPTKVRAPTMPVAAPAAVMVVVMLPAAGTPPAADVAPEPVKVTLIQPFWKFCGAVTDSELREPRTPELLPDTVVCAMLLRMLIAAQRRAY